MKITKVSLEEIMSSYDDPNLQQAAVAFVGALRNFDKTEDDEYLYMMDDIADEISEKIPYDEVNFMGEWTSEKSFVLLVTVMKMARLGYLPSVDIKDIWMFSVFFDFCYFLFSICDDRLGVLLMNTVFHIEELKDEIAKRSKHCCTLG